MIEIWYAILVFVFTTYVVLDGRNFGAGALHLIVTKTAAERRQVVAAIGPLWSWHEVWLVALGGVLFVAFPRFLATAFSGYYLALYLVLWSLILRGISLEVGGHIDNRLWQGFWDFVFTVSNILLAVLFGTALGNLARGVSLDSNGEFHLAFFTDFQVRGHTGLLDWYTISLGLFTLVILAAHGATYLTLKTEGAVHERSQWLTRRLWVTVCPGLVVITIETWFVRPEFFNNMLHRPLAWLAVLTVLAGGAAIFTGIRSRMEFRAFAGSCTIIVGLLAAGAASIFPVILRSTLDPEHSLTVYNSSASRESLAVAIVWWPIALILASCYFVFISRRYRGKVKPSTDTQGYY
jgi:cytochrome bd ubiquinol oxidase subunit II